MSNLALISLLVSLPVRVRETKGPTAYAYRTASTILRSRALAALRSHGTNVESLSQQLPVNQLRPNYIPGRMRPFFSASSIMFLPMRSLTLLHGSMVSSLAATRAPAPAVTVFNHTWHAAQQCTDGAEVLSREISRIPRPNQAADDVAQALVVEKFPTHRRYRAAV